MITPLLVGSLAFVAGVATATGFAAGWVEAAALALVAAAAGLRAAGRPWRVALWTLAIPLLFAGGLLRAGEGPPELGDVAEVAAGRRVQLTGVVAADPTIREGLQRVRVAAETVALGGERHPVEGIVQLTAPPAPRLRYGDRISGTVLLRRPPAEGPEDLRALLEERGVAALGAVRDLRVLARDQGNALRAAVSRLRDRVDRALLSALDEPLAGLALGIVTGRRDSLDPDLQVQLNETGLSHLVVISGSNVTIVAALLVAGSAWAIGRRSAVALALAAIAAYTVFVGADAPVVRAAIMGTLFLLAGLLGRRSSPAPAVAFAAAVMLAVSPSVITGLSFQLSFAATAALATLAMPLHDRIERWSGVGPATAGVGGALVRVGIETLALTLVAIAATLPLIALHFGRISLVALPANLLVVPAFPSIFLGSLATGIGGTISETLGVTLGWLMAWLPLSWFVAVTEALASLPLAAAQVDGFGLEYAILLYGALAALALWLYRTPLPRRRAARWGLPALERPLALFAAGVLVATNLVVWPAVAERAPDDLRVDLLNVGQGDAILARAPSGRTLLVDGGPDGATLVRELTAALSGRRTIDVVVATHPDADHVNGLFTLLDRFRVGTLLVSPLNDRAALGRTLVAEAEARGIPVRVATPGTVIDLGAGVLVEVIGPLPPLEPGAEMLLNNAAVVLRIAHEDVQFLLAGDIEAAAELALAMSAAPLHATVLKVAHHGSRTSSTDLFLRRVQPSLALISVGAGNRFDHPHDAVLERLEGVPVLRTDQSGTITLRSDGTTLRIHTAR